MFKVCLIAIVITATFFAHVCFSSCPNNVKTMYNFDAQRYLGRWYEYAKSPVMYGSNDRCTYAEYGSQQNGDVSISNHNVNKNTGRETDVKGSARIVGDGKLTVRLDGMPALRYRSDYWVLGTDYKDYTVVYSCNNSGYSHKQVAWILTRERLPRAETIETAKDIIREQRLSLATLKKTDQHNCPQ